MAAGALIRIGFIGAGSICRTRHLPNLAQIDGVEVVVVCNRSERSSNAVADEFGIPEIETDWKRLVERDDLDAVFIGTWPYMHREMSVACLEAGKHVFCQARMSTDLAEARLMLEAARKQPELVNMICPPPHRMPFEPFVKHMIETGKLGELTLVELRQTSGGNLNPNSVTWREQVEYSGKQILAMGICAETLNAWVGPYASLNAALATPIPVKRDADDNEVRIQIPQVATISGQLENGALILEHHTGLAADSTTVSPDEPGLTLWGTEGTLRVRMMKSVQFGPKGQPLEEVEVPEAMRNPWTVEQDFIDAVRAARAGESWEVSPDFEEGLAYMQKIEAVHLAAESGKAVDPRTL